MLIKILAAIAVLVIAWLALTGRRAVGRETPVPAAPRVPRAEDLTKCPRCGVWLPAETPCDCTGRS